MTTAEATYQNAINEYAHLYSELVNIAYILTYDKAKRSLKSENNVEKLAWDSAYSAVFLDDNNEGKKLDERVNKETTDTFIKLENGFVKKWRSTLAVTRKYNSTCINIPICESDITHTKSKYTNAIAEHTEKYKNCLRSIYTLTYKEALKETLKETKSTEEAHKIAHDIAYVKIFTNDFMIYSIL